jgi:hypothetical protein
MNNTIRKIKQKPLKDTVTTVRLTKQQKEMIDASAKINKVNKSVVISDAISTYFNINQ